VEVEVFVLPDDELQSADDMIRCGVSHGCVPILLASDSKPLIFPREVRNVVPDRLKQSLEDFESVPLVFRCKTVEWIERIGRDDSGKSKVTLLTSSLCERELYNLRNRLLYLVSAVVIAILCPSDMIPHNMGTDLTSLRFASRVIRTCPMDEEETGLVVWILRRSHIVRVWDLLSTRAHWRVPGLVVVDEKGFFEAESFQLYNMSSLKVPELVQLRRPR
jgi:hypothetical protein